MSNVIHVKFGTEREWKRTHEKLVDGLVAVGALFGDPASLMQAKADCVMDILRTIVEDVPTVEFTSKLPEDLTEKQVEVVVEAIKHAALQGVEVAMTHAVSCLMAYIYDLCTSKLSSRPPHR